MSRSELRVQAAANQPEAAKDPAAGDRAAKAPDAAPPQADAPPVGPQLPRPPWLVRNSRVVIIGLVLATAAASPFVYIYLRSNFGPDPFAGIKLEGVRFDPYFGANTPAAPAAKTPAPSTPATVPAAVPSAKRSPAPATAPVAATSRLPVATVPVPVGVTHTRPSGAPASAAPEVRPQAGEPRARIGREPAGARACPEAVAALGLCSPK